MIIPLYHYRSGYRIASLAKCEETLRILQAQGLDALFLQEGSMVLYPDEERLFPDEQGVQRLAECDDYDV